MGAAAGAAFVGNDAWVLAAGAMGRVLGLEVLPNACDKGCMGGAEVCGEQADCSEGEENTCLVAFDAISRVF